MQTEDEMIWDEAREMARDALGGQADDEILLQEVAEQIYQQITGRERGADA